ncbi:MAG: hypothetical protein JNM24_02160 [Bdellovibrionaceae bacterium]|nr:hypothetical protein [Pseudobdellovibrionaceae bacterium]
MRRLKVLFLFVLSTFGFKGLTQSIYENVFSKNMTDDTVKINLYEKSTQKNLASGNWASGGGRTKT